MHPFDPFKPRWVFFVCVFTDGDKDEPGGIFKKTPTKNVIADGSTPPEGFKANPLGFPDGTVFEMEYVTGPGMVQLHPFPASHNSHAVVWPT